MDSGGWKVASVTESSDSYQGQTSFLSIDFCESHTFKITILPFTFLDRELACMDLCLVAKRLLITTVSDSGKQRLGWDTLPH